MAGYYVRSTPDVTNATACLLILVAVHGIGVDLGHRRTVITMNNYHHEYGLFATHSCGY